MTSARNTTWLAAAFLAAGLLTGAQALAQATDPTELAFWQTIQNSTDPAEYDAYLHAFPHGTFAALARARMERLRQNPAAAPGQTQAPAPAPTPAAAPPAPDPEPAATVDEKLTVSPQPGRVGDLLKITCTNLPKPFYTDAIVVVRAGTPDINPLTTRDDMKILARAYPQNCISNGFVEVGPFAPGRYEARFVTALYNDDHTPEVRTRTAFTVR